MFFLFCDWHNEEQKNHSFEDSVQPIINCIFFQFRLFQFKHNVLLVIYIFVHDEQEQQIKQYRETLFSLD